MSIFVNIAPAWLFLLLSELFLTWQLGEVTNWYLHCLSYSSLLIGLGFEISACWHTTWGSTSAWTKSFGSWRCFHTQERRAEDGPSSSGQCRAGRSVLWWLCTCYPFIGAACRDRSALPEGNTVFSSWWQYFVFHFRAPVQVPKVQWSWNACLSFIQGKHRKCCCCTGLCAVGAESSSSVWD